MTWTSPKYKKWVTEQPCAACSLPAPSDPHHIKGVGHLSGGSMKAPDWALMPLCRNCHQQMHRTPELWDWQWELALRTLGRYTEIK